MYRGDQRDTMDEVMTRQDARMRLYDVHDNVLLYFEEVCLPVLELLSIDDYTKYVNSIVNRLKQGEYDLAWSGVIAFAELPGVLGMFPDLDSKIEPGIAILSKAAHEFDVP